MGLIWRYVCCTGWLLAAAQGADLAGLGYPAQAVATDAAGNVYLAGSTKSLSLEVKNAYQPRPGESQFLRSEDGGASWIRAGNLPSDPPTALVADPATPGLLYAGGLDGLYESTDGGITWRVVLKAEMPSYPGVVNILVDPTEPKRVFALAPPKGLLRSEDAGETWSTVISQQTGSDMDRIWIDPHGSGTIIAAMQQFRISRDNGRTWEPLPWPGGMGAPRMAAFDPHHKGWIYLSTAAGTLGQFYVSTDYGKTWRERTNPRGAVYYDLVLDPERPDVIYAATLAGFERSEDGALTWKQVAPSMQRLAVLPKDCGPAGTLVAVTPRGAARSSDAGDNWTDMGISGVRQVAAGAGCAVWLGRGIASDAFVAKVSPEGETLWATYLGGMGDETPRRIAVDAQGNVTVAGLTSSGDFPGEVRGVRGFSDIFVTRFDANGALVYSSVLAGSAGEELSSLSVDNDGNALISGRTYSPDFPLTAGTPHPAGAFVARLEANGSLAYAIAFPVSLSVAPAPGGGTWVATSEGELLTLNTSGDVVTSRRLCEKCAASALATDAQGSLYVAGNTANPAFPTTPGSYGNGVRSTSCRWGGNRYSSGPGDLFLMKFEPYASEPTFSAVIGADCQTVPDALFVDDRGRLTVSAQTLAAAFPLVRPIWGSPLPGGFTGVVLRFSAGARDLTFSTYTDSAVAPGIAPGPGESLYIGSRLVDFAPAPGPRLDRVMHAFRGSATVPPGGLVMLTGIGLGPEEWTDLGLNARERLPYELKGTSVRFDGRPAPIISVGFDRAVCVTPAGLNASTLVEVSYQGVASNPVLMWVTPGAGLLNRAFPGQPPYNPSAPPPDGVVRNEDGTLNDADHPARPGSKITLFLTGLLLSPEPGSIAADESEVGRVWVSWISGRISTSGRLVKGFVSALTQAEVTVPALPSIVTSGRTVLQLYSSNPEYNPRALPDSNPIAVWVQRGQ